MPLSDLRERTWRGFLDFAWRQWAQLGISSNIEGFDCWAVDPEALIIFTIEVARHDPRLFDEVLDWLSHNRRLLTMQRLWNLGARFPVDAGLVGAAVAWAGESPPSRWQKNYQVKDQHSEKVFVFDSDVLSFIAESDPTFAEYGYIRPRVARSGKSREPDVKIPANFAFQLRYLFGPGSRSEVMRILLTFPDGPLDAARIASEACFAKRNISDTLAGLVVSRVIKASWSGNERHYIAYRNKWATLLEVGPSAERMPVFISWVNLFPACLEILKWLDRVVDSENSDYLIASQARSLMERVAHNLEISGIEVSPKRATHGAAYLSNFVATVESIFSIIGVTDNPNSSLSSSV
jgi:hypothetical protein